MGFNRFTGRGPYTAEVLPISGYHAILDKYRRIVLQPVNNAGEPYVEFSELQYIANLLNAHDLLDGSN